MNCLTNQGPPACALRKSPSVVRLLIGWCWVPVDLSAEGGSNASTPNRSTSPQLSTSAQNLSFNPSAHRSGMFTLHCCVNSLPSRSLNGANAVLGKQRYSRAIFDMWSLCPQHLLTLGLPRSEFVSSTTTPYNCPLGPFQGPSTPRRRLSKILTLIYHSVLWP